VIAVITGASTGIGRALARVLQTNANHLVLVGRNPSRYAEVLRPSDDFVECELTSLASVANAAQSVASRVRQVDLLINNAAVAGKRGTTADGFELAFGVNYLSHYLLTRLLGGVLRVVNVSSEAHRTITDLSPEHGRGTTRTPLGWREYKFSKAAQIAFTCALASRGYNAYAAHPGVIATDLWRQIPNPLRYLVVRGMGAPAIGALPVLRASTDASLSPGDYVTPRGVVAPSPAATNANASERLWEQSERWVSAYLS
jgi:retinol dehydrogenase-12